MSKCYNNQCGSYSKNSEKQCLEFEFPSPSKCTCYISSADGGMRDKDVSEEERAAEERYYKGFSHKKRINLDGIWPSKTAKLALEIARLVDRKQAAYGYSFGKSGDVLAILYPDGIEPEQYGDMLCVVRIIDKLFRIAHEKDAFGESPYSDICGYSLLGAMKGDK